MDRTLSEEDLGPTLNNLRYANERFNLLYPGDSELRQPVHTVYGGAHLFKYNTAVKMGELAKKWFVEYAPNEKVFSTALGLLPQDDLASKIYSRVEQKLAREALEDFRIDFEDGFGNRPDQEEDETALMAAREILRGMKEGTLPPFIGIRIKPLSEELASRSIRTLDLFLTEIFKEEDARLPVNFVVTLPKITSSQQVSTLVDIFEILEDRFDLEEGSLKMEFMVETPQSLLSVSGESALNGFLAASKGRCRGAHFGTYDFTASINITANYQFMDHSSCDFALSFMKAALSGTGVWLSDGATNVMPVGPHKGEDLTNLEKEENQRSVHKAWQLCFKHIRHSLKNGYYQGWDLHPGQLPVRYGALFSFFLEGLAPATKRLKNFIDQAAKATLVGDVFDDAATGQGLLNYFLKAYNSGAIGEEEILKTGLSLEEVRLRSFNKIIKGRRNA